MNAPATEVSNPFGSSAVAARNAGAMVSVEQSRVIAEVQAAMMIARMNPRDQIESMDRILNACARPGLADAAIYTYARGGSDISGPSIRLAEAMAQAWGNIKTSVRELEQRDGVSTMQTIAWDLETGYQVDKVFQVKHERHTKKGSYALTDPRDVYELSANQAARRLRACILAVIPGDVTEAAVAQCEVTMKTKADTSPEAMQKMVAAFEPFGVTKEQIETRIQRRLEAIQPAQVVSLKKIYASLRDNMSAPADWFEVAPAATDTAAKPATGASALKAAVSKKPASVNKDTGEVTGNSMHDDDDPTLGIPGAGDVSHVGDGAPKVDYVKLCEQLRTFTDIDAGDNAATLIGELEDFGERNTASKIYQERRAELTAPKGKK